VGISNLNATVSQKTILVFPATGEEAITLVQAARARGEKVVCASSVVDSTAEANFGPILKLPSIHEAAFEAAFINLAGHESVGVLFAPVSSVYAFMRKFLPLNYPRIQLLGKSPVQLQMDKHRTLMDRAAAYMPWVALCSNGNSSLSQVDIAAVLRQASSIYGESNDDKLAGMMGVFARAPRGDVIEIGSLMGRSAFVMLFLARHYDIGHLLTVDPWSAAECSQDDSPEALQWVTDEWDYEVIREGFAVNLAAFGSKDNAHIRLPSSQTFAKYSTAPLATSFGGHEVAYVGKVAVIHIDGNHDYDTVSEDCDLWLTLLAPGAWLILDDYLWAHGDGPYRKGNELLSKQADRIESTFVCGKALFVKFH
jgi:hypothetical protein